MKNQKLEMSEADIVSSYIRNGKSKAQIQILADLNGCGKETIIDVLRRSGKVDGRSLRYEGKKKGESTMAAVVKEKMEKQDENAMKARIKELEAENEKLKKQKLDYMELMSTSEEILVQISDVVGFEGNKEKPDEFYKGLPRAVIEKLEVLNKENYEMKEQIERMKEHIKGMIESRNESEKATDKILYKIAGIVNFTGHIRDMPAAVDDYIKDIVRNASKQEELEKAQGMVMKLVEKYVL